MRFLPRKELGIFDWYWLADLCAEHHIRFVLGHALYMKAIHGGKTKNDKIDSYKLAGLLKGGNFPIAYAYPAKWRATRDLLRRRMYLAHRCGELVAHIVNTNTQYNHAGVAERFEDPQVRKSVEVGLEMIAAMNQLLSKLEYHIEKTAHGHDYHTLYLLRSIPGVGQIPALGIFTHKLGRAIYFMLKSKKAFDMKKFFDR